MPTLLGDENVPLLQLSVLTPVSLAIIEQLARRLKI